MSAIGMPLKILELFKPGVPIPYMPSPINKTRREQRRRLDPVSDFISRLDEELDIAGGTVGVAKAVAAPTKDMTRFSGPNSYLFFNADKTQTERRFKKSIEEKVNAQLIRVKFMYDKKGKFRGFGFIEFLSQLGSAQMEKLKDIAKFTSLR
jgi:U1 small nuclear ribonucleoprotein of 70kDa MW N terminal